MGSRRKQLRSLLALPVLLLAPLAAADEARLHPAAPNGEVDILNPSGSTRIVGWDRPEIAVQGRGGRPAHDVSISGSGGKTKIRVGSHDNPMSGSTIEVQLPRGSRVTVKSFNARITAENLTGSLTAESFEGSLSVQSGPPQITLKSTSGSLEVEAAASKVDVESVNGSIRLRGVGGKLRAKTVNGSVTVEGRRFDEVKLSSVSGKVRFEGGLNPKGQVEARSVNGAVELRLPRDTAGSFVLGSTNGRLQSDFYAGAGDDQDHPGDRKMRFTIGSGGAQIEARSVNGSVTVSKR